MKSLARPPVVFIVFDGLGVAPPGPGNAVTLARTPNLDRLMRRHPYTTLAASGSSVGLPYRQEGNSEAGHMNIGAGRVVLQDSIRISRSIADGSFFKNAAFRAAIHHVKKYRSRLHLMGLLTAQQSAHADPDHLLALLALARNFKIKSVYLHLFTDGRDSPPRSAIHLLRTLESGLKPNEKIVTIMGRFYAMDRKKMWDRTKQAFEAMVHGQGQNAKTADEAILQAYERNETDEFIHPTTIGLPRQHRIKANDSVVFFNLRSDRARQLAKFFIQKSLTKNVHAPSSTGALIRRLPKNLVFVAMTDFGPDLDEMITAFPSVELYNTLPVILRRFRQLYIAENEKYAHVSFFFNGGYDKPVAGEDRILVPSPNVRSYDQTPAMSAPEVTRRITDDLQRRQHDIIVVNFANPDMIGHTGNLRAAVEAIEVVDDCVGKIWAAVKQRGGSMIITADHGNAEQMLAADGKSVHTEHTTNPVPFLIVTPEPLKMKLRRGGKLADVAPTILQLLDMQQPVSMTGRSLLEAHAL